MKKILITGANSYIGVSFEKYMEKAKLYIGSETDNKENYIRVLKIISDI